MIYLRTIREKIEIMQAHERGEQIQWIDEYSDGEWMDCTKPTWDWLRTDYRVKPSEPKMKKVTLHAYLTGSGQLAHWKEGTPLSKNGWKRIPSLDIVAEVEV